MTDFGWKLVSILAIGLGPGEREVVLGDLAESGAHMGVAVRELLGLIIRRQAGTWTQWCPWLALFGIAGLAGSPLGRLAFSLNGDIVVQLATHRTYGVWYETGLTGHQELISLLCLALGLVAWSWACGFVLGSLSGRAVWFTWYVLWLVVVHSAWARFVLSGDIVLKHPLSLRNFVFLLLPLPASPSDLFVFVPSLWGAFQGFRRRVPSIRAAYLIVVAIAVITGLTAWIEGWHETALELWSGGVLHAASWSSRHLPYLLISWPAAWLFGTAHRHHTRRGTSA